MLVSRLVSALVTMGLDHMVRSTCGFIGLVAFVVLGAVVRPSDARETRDTDDSRGMLLVWGAAVGFLLLMTQA